ELLQRSRLSLRLRGTCQDDPGPLPGRQEGRGHGRRPERARRRGRALRPQGTHHGPPGGLARVARRHDDPGARATGGASHDGRDRALSTADRGGRVTVRAVSLVRPGSTGEDRGMARILFLAVLTILAAPTARADDACLSGPSTLADQRAI